MLCAYWQLSPSVHVVSALTAGHLHEHACRGGAGTWAGQPKRAWACMQRGDAEGMQAGTWGGQPKRAWACMQRGGAACTRGGKPYKLSMNAWNISAVLGIHTYRLVACMVFMPRNSHLPSVFELADAPAPGPFTRVCILAGTPAVQGHQWCEREVSTWCSWVRDCHVSCAAAWQASMCA